MLMPSSYKSEYATRQDMSKDLVDNGRLNVSKTISYVEGIQNQNQMNTFMEFLESEDDLFPYMLYTSQDDELEYLHEIDFDYAHVCEAFIDIDKQDIDNDLNYYHIKPYQWNNGIAYSLEPITKSQLIHSLKVYQKHPDDDNFNVRVERDAQPNSIKKYNPSTIMSMQDKLHDLMNQRANLSQIADFLNKHSL